MKIGVPLEVRPVGLFEEPPRLNFVFVVEH
jgi:hypothetical protein